MVGTGRIELPTSSVSRKRSPTELRACKTSKVSFPPGLLGVSNRALMQIFPGRCKRLILLPIFRMTVNLDWQFWRPLLEP